MNLIKAGQCRFLDAPHALEILDEVYHQDCYRLGEVPRESTVIDAGAFYGEFGILCAVERGCSVIAIEPNKEAINVLLQNLELNGITEKFATLECALTHRLRRDRKLVLRADHPAGNALSDLINQPGIAAIPVDTISLPELIGLVNSNSIVLKLDCEGAEAEIFEDDIERSLANVSIVTMEWHNRDGKRYADKLSELGFKVELAGGGNPRPPWEPGMNGGLIFARRP